MDLEDGGHPVELEDLGPGKGHIFTIFGQLHIPHHSPFFDNLRHCYFVHDFFLVL